MAKDHDDNATQELWQRLRKLRVAMMTTFAPDGSIRSRPMTLQDLEPDGTMWFFAAADSEVSEVVSRDARINVAFADHADSFYASFSGRAFAVHDLEKAQALWSPFAAAWFPGGPADPSLWLLRVDPQQVDYWTTTSGKITQMAAMLKAALTRTPPGPELGERGSFVPPAAGGPGVSARA